MKISKRVGIGLLTTSVVTVSLLGLASPASATSDYDDLLTVTPQLYVYTDGATKSQTMDISGIWWEEFKQSYALRLQQNIGWPTNFVSTFESYVSSGGSWGVWETETEHGVVITLAATDDPEATCSFGGSIETGYYACWADPGYGYVKAEYFTHASYGGNGCYGGGGNRCSDNGLNVYSAPTVQAPGAYGAYVAVLSNSNAANQKVFMMNFINEYPIGYAGVMLPTLKRTTGADYVAMGDSYSSGEGNSPYEAHSDMDGLNECHRSISYSYSYPISHDATLGLEDVLFVACSGATTNSILNGSTHGGGWGEGAQVDALTAATDAVTLTIGGNDLGFKEVIDEYCSNQLGGNNGWGCNTNTSLNAVLVERIDALYGEAAGTVMAPSGEEIHSILEVLEEIHTRAPNAAIYIAGYPKLFGSSSSYYTADASAPGGSYCTTGTGVSFSYSDAQWMNGLADTINGVISDAVDSAQTEGVDVTYVSPGGFNGNGFCDSGTPYLYEVMIENLSPLLVNPGSLHPTTTGAVIGYGVAFQYAMS